MITFSVETEPVGKGRPRFCANRRVYTPQKTVVFEKTIADAARIAYRRPPLIYPIELEIVLTYTIPKSWSKKKKDTAVFPRKPDIDNVAKAVMDALEGVIYVDDSQVADLIVTKRYAPCPLVLVSVAHAASDRFLL